MAALAGNNIINVEQIAKEHLFLIRGSSHEYILGERINVTI